LLLALIDLPDFGTSLGRIADSTETLAGRKSREGAAELPPTTMTDLRQTDVPVVPREDAPAASVVRLRLLRARSWAGGIFTALARWWRRVYSSMVGRQVREGDAELSSKTMAGVKQANANEALPEKHGEAEQGKGAVSTRPEFPQESPFDRTVPLPLRQVKGS
jgi:hypothetical protein